MKGKGFSIVRKRLSGLLLLCTSFMLSGCFLSIRFGDETAPNSAVYKVTFSSQWNASSFPTNYPFNSELEPIFTVNHNASLSLFSLGSTATTGIRQFAETGNTNALRTEVRRYQNQNLAGNITELSPVGREVSFFLRVTQSQPSVTILASLFPSPDWFAAVSGQRLFQDEKWLDSATIQLAVFDAGTDSGETFTSPNAPEIPARGVSLLSTNRSDSDFRVGKHYANGNAVATVTFSLQ
ncbi:spondin domain-containing protein [Veronia pacifica]|nr:spondin domain-containing protein [Veronia pacifica]